MHAYMLDLDNDANADFLFLTYDTTIVTSSLSIGLKAVAAMPYQSGNAVGGTYSSAFSTNVAKALNNGVLVDPSLNWMIGTGTGSSSVMLMALAETIPGYGTINAGQFSGTTDKFTGLRFTTNGNTYYGWARFDVAQSSNQFTIKDYAYNGQPNGAILTGAQFNNTINLKPVEVAAYAFGNKVNIVFGNASEANGTVLITDVTGHELKSENINAQIMHIDMSDVAAGTYFVSVKQSNGTVTTKKVFID